MEAKIAEALEVSAGHPDVAAACAMARVRLWLERDDLARVSSALDLAMGRLGDAAAIGGPERGLWTLLRIIEQRGTPSMIADLEASPAFTLVANKAYRSYALAVMSGRAGDHLAAAEHMADGDRAVTPIIWFQHHAHRLIAESALAEGWGDPISWLRDAVTYFEQHGPDQLVSTCRAMLARAGAATPRRLADGGTTSRRTSSLPASRLAKSTYSSDLHPPDPRRTSPPSSSCHRRPSSATSPTSP